MFTEVTPIITEFAGNLQEGVVGLVGVLVPAGLALWGLGFGIKKGLGFLQKKASRAL